MNQTILKFGYPDTLIREFPQWVVLLRQKQVTLGSVILACKESAQALPEITVPAFMELKQITGELETTLREAFSFDKINYMMLMMVDPHVHFHVIPRYSSSRSFENVSFPDPGWPKHPDILHVTEVPNEVFLKLRQRLADLWTTGR